MNRVAIFARLGTTEVVQADNARAALFLAMACARQHQTDEACRWLAEARGWIDGEGQQFVPPLTVSSDDGQTQISAGAAAPSAGQTARATAPSTVDNPRRGSISLADRLFLADILFELQVLSEEAQQMIDCRAKGGPHDADDNR